MDTRQLEYIIAIAEEGSLSRAADRLFITQSALSQQLASLKAQGLPPLFMEKKRRMELTDAGKIYLNGARAILRIETMARRDLDMLSGDSILPFHISVAPYLQKDFFVHILPRLKTRFPGLPVSVRADNVLSTRANLNDGSIDLAFIPDIYRQRDFFRYEQVLTEELVVVCGQPAADFWQLPFLIPPENSYLRELCHRIFSHYNCQPEIYAEIDDPDTALRMLPGQPLAAILPRRIASVPDLQLYSFAEPYYYNLSCVLKDTGPSPVKAAVLEELQAFYSSLRKK